MGGNYPPFVLILSNCCLIFALAFELFELAALPFNFELVLVDLLVLLTRLIIPSLQLVADQSARA